MSVIYRETVDEESTFRIIINAMEEDFIEPGGLQVGVRIYDEGY